MLATLAWVALEKALGWHDEKIEVHATYTNFYAVVAIAIYVFALIDKKKNFYHGKMDYRQGFMTGLILTLFITLLSPFTQYLTSTVITPDYFSNVITYAVASGNMSQEEAENYFNLKNYLFQSVVGALVMGLLTSAGVAFFVRTKS